MVVIAHVQNGEVMIEGWPQAAPQTRGQNTDEYETRRDAPRQSPKDLEAFVVEKRLFPHSPVSIDI